MWKYLFFPLAWMVMANFGLTAKDTQNEGESDLSIRIGIYKHYKGNLYQVIGLARHSETLEPLVVYRALYEPYGLWVRPGKMFLETVTIDGKEIPRFAFQHSIDDHTPKI